MIESADYPVFVRWVSDQCDEGDHQRCPRNLGFDSDGVVRVIRCECLEPGCHG